MRLPIYPVKFSRKLPLSCALTCFTTPNRPIHISHAESIAAAPACTKTCGEITGAGRGVLSVVPPSADRTRHCCENMMARRTSLRAICVAATATVARGFLSSSCGQHRGGSPLPFTATSATTHVASRGCASSPAWRPAAAVPSRTTRLGELRMVRNSCHGRVVEPVPRCH